MKVKLMFSFLEDSFSSLFKARRTKITKITIEIIHYFKVRKTIDRQNFRSVHIGYHSKARKNL